MFDNNIPQIEAVLNLCNETLTKYVPVLSHRSFQVELLIGLCQFKNYVRCKEFWLQNRAVIMEESRSEEEEDYFDKEGLGTKLRPKSKGAYKGSDDLDNLISQLER